MGSGQSGPAVQGDLSCPHFGRGPRRLLFLSGKEAGSPGAGSGGRARGPGRHCTPCLKAPSAWMNVTTAATTATTVLGTPEGKLVRGVLLSIHLRGEHTGPEG